MRKEYTYKLQGNGKDSWIVREFNEDNELINSYMIYEDPNILPIPKVDVVGLLQILNENELNQIREILKIN